MNYHHTLYLLGLQEFKKTIYKYRLYILNIINEDLSKILLNQDPYKNYWKCVFISIYGTQRKFLCYSASWPVYYIWYFEGNTNIFVFKLYKV